MARDRGRRPDLDARPERLDDATDQIALDPRPLAPLQVDDVKVPRDAAPRRREGRRIVVVDGQLVVVALVETNGVTSEKIDRGPELHADLALQKGGQETKAGGLAFFGVKLRSENVVPGDGGGDRDRTVLRRRGEQRPIGRDGVERVREVEVRPVASRRGEVRVHRPGDSIAIPSHVGIFKVSPVAASRWPSGRRTFVPRKDARARPNPGPPRSTRRAPAGPGRCRRTASPVDLRAHRGPNATAERGRAIAKRSLTGHDHLSARSMRPGRP